MWQNLQGRFVVADGPDGGGKTTLLQRLSEACPLPNVVVRDPGGTVLSEKLRDLLLSPDMTMSANVQVLVFTAARVSLWEEVVGPALMEGKIVFSDRWTPSTLVYQGIVAEQGVDRVLGIAHHFGTLQFVLADCMLILDLDPEVAATRCGTTDRFESKGLGYMRKIRQGYLDVRNRFPNSFLIDASQPEPDVDRRVLECLAQCKFDW